MSGIESGKDEILKQRLVSLTRDLVLMPSSASRPEDRTRCYEFIKNHLDSLDTVRIHEYEAEGIPSLVALPSGCETPEVLLCGHLDVIGHKDTRCYRSWLDQGRIYGPGSGDMKGPLAIMMEIFRRFHTRHPGLSLGIAVTSDEEIGGELGIGHIFQHAGLRCGLAMIPDAGGLNQITIEEKGILHLVARCRGVPGHAARPWLCSNPIERLVKSLARVCEVFEKTWPPDSANDYWHPTCAVTLIDADNETVNAIPPAATATLDIRFPHPHTAEALHRLVAETMGEDVEVDVMIDAEPVLLSPDETYRTITEEITGEKAFFVRGHGGSDARFISSLGIPVLMSRPLVGNLHAPDEWIDIDSMGAFYRIYERYLARKFGGLEPPEIFE